MSAVVRCSRRRSPLASTRIALTSAVGGVVLLSLPCWAAASAPGEDAPADALPPQLDALRGDAAAEALWARGMDAERNERLLDSSRDYEAIESRLPGSAFLKWRIARNYWRHAEQLPAEDKSGRLHYYELADAWAGRALEDDPECGDCVLWKMAAMGRVATTGGVMQSLHLAPVIAEMIERGIALNPTHRDEGNLNASLANLYYAGAAFYRIVPDWFWVQWVLGVRGDRERALAYIRKAVEMSDPRIDYQVELGAVLLCMGHDRHDERRLEEGRRALREATGIAPFQSTDALDLAHAQVLLAQPERACGYTRDGWLDLNEVRGGF